MHFQTSQPLPAPPHLNSPDGDKKEKSKKKSAEALREEGVLLLEDGLALVVEGPGVALVVQGGLQVHELRLAPGVALDQAPLDGLAKVLLETLSELAREVLVRSVAAQVAYWKANL